MNLSDIAIRRPVFTAMMSVALIVFGLLSYRTLSVDQYPPVDFPFMIVRTIWPGAAPEDVERDVTRKVEDAVASAPGLDQLKSFTRDSVSVVMLQFEMGSDLGQAVSAVRDRVGTVEGDLPTGVIKPVIQQVDIGALPVVVVALSSPNGIDATRRLADERLRPFLEQIDGVGSVNVLGGQDREIQVDLDLDALRSLGVSPMDVVQRIGWENLSLPVGQFDQQGYTIGIRADGQYKSVADLNQTVVSMTQDGRQVRLGEVANVLDDFARAERYVRFDRQDAVALEIVKRSGSNTVEVAHQVREVLAREVPTLGEGVNYDVISDTSIDVEANAHEVWIAIWFGGAAAILVIMFFLLDLRGTFISALALPTSVIGTFAAMSALGFSINTMTLLGLSLAIGLLIDDAVVVRESITRRLEAGDSPTEAASRGTREIALAVMATTMSLVAVFVPVAFMSGIVGQFFRQFGLTIAVAVLLSLFVAFTLDPMLSSRLSRARRHDEVRWGLAGAIERLLQGVDVCYTRMLGGVLVWRKTTVMVALGTLVATALLATQIPAEFVPEEDRSEFLADMRLPVGSSLDTTARSARRAETLLMGMPGVRRVYTVVGLESNDNVARFRVKVVPKGERSEPLPYFSDMARRLVAAAAGPQAEVNIAKPGMIEGLGDWPPLMIVVQGENGELVEKEADRLMAMLKAIPGTVDVRLSVTPGRPELHLAIDRAVAADRGVPAGLVASTARALVEGQIVGTLRDDGDEADIRVRAAPRFAVDPTAIAALPLPSPRGLVTVGEVAKVHMGAGPSEIQRTDRLRSVTVSTQLAPGGALGTIVESFGEQIKAAPMAKGTFYTIEGQAQDMEETANAMGLAITIAMAFIFMVLASQFESLAHPFTLLVSVPLAMVGAILALFVTGQSFSMGSQIGMILLMGLVTKNAILLVDGALANMRDGHDAVAAMQAAGARRLRPIVMTSASMVFGMLPTALGNGIGAEFRAPMAISVIGGVISSTVLTLLVVPIVFVWVEGLKERASALWTWLNGASAAPHPVASANTDAEEAAK